MSRKMAEREFFAAQATLADGGREARERYAAAYNRLAEHVRGMRPMARAEIDQWHAEQEASTSA